MSVGRTNLEIGGLPGLAFVELFVSFPGRRNGQKIGKTRKSPRQTGGILGTGGPLYFCVGTNEAAAAKYLEKCSGNGGGTIIVWNYIPTCP